jgi:hypothetical protein
MYCGALECGIFFGFVQFIFDPCRRPLINDHLGFGSHESVHRE